jgi:hypothetical protein
LKAKVNRKIRKRGSDGKYGTASIFRVIPAMEWFQYRRWRNLFLKSSQKIISSF